MPDETYQYEETRALVQLVKDAADLVAARGEAAFDDLREAGSRWRPDDTYVFVLDPGAFGLLRDRTGPFVFMDTYVFVIAPDGTQLVNPGLPSLEGRSLIDLRDLNGKPAVRDEIATALGHGRAWLEAWWYKPGQNTPALKQSYVRKAQFGEAVYVVGSGIYPE